MINFVFNGREIIIRVRFVAPLDAAPTLSLFEDGSALVHDPIVGVGSGSVWVFTFTPTGLTIGKLFQAEATGLVEGMPIYKEVICATVAEWEELPEPPVVIVPPGQNAATSVGYLTTLNNQSVLTPGITVWFQLIKGPRTPGYLLGTAPFSRTSDANAQIIITDVFKRNGRYKAWVNNVNQATEFDVPDENSFPIPETLDW
jgi:hypothetical protein